MLRSNKKPSWNSLPGEMFIITFLLLITFEGVIEVNKWNNKVGTISSHYLKAPKDILSFNATGGNLDYKCQSSQKVDLEVEYSECDMAFHCELLNSNKQYELKFSQR